MLHTIYKQANPKNSPSRSKGCPKGGVVDHLEINGTKIYPHYTPHLPYNCQLHERSKQLRKAGVLSEVIFWQQVKGKKFWQLDFDRQRVIGNYVVDFYIKSLSLVIEIDGTSHNEKGGNDEIRQNYLESLGLKILRIDDKEVKNNISGVMKYLELFIINEYSIPRNSKY